MTDRQLQYILTIVEERNITSAAQKLRISQPSLSALLAKVESELDIKIFNRNDNPLTLTYEGKCYIKAARNILNSQKEMLDTIADIKKGNNGSLVVGCGQQSSSILLPLILPKFIVENPGIKLELIEDQLSTFERMLINHKMDVAFVTYSFDNDMLENVQLYQEEVVLMAPLSYNAKLTKQNENCVFPICDIHDLDRKPFVLFKQGRYLRKMADRILDDYGIRPNIILETSSWETCIELVKAGLAFTLLPYSPFLNVDVCRNTRCYSINENYKRQISLCYKKREYHTIALEQFIACSKNMIDSHIKNNTKISVFNIEKKLF